MMSSSLLNKLRKLNELAKAKKATKSGMDLSSLSDEELQEMERLVEKVQVFGLELTQDEKTQLTRLCEWCVSRQGQLPLTRAEALKAAREAEESGEV